MPPPPFEGDLVRLVQLLEDSFGLEPTGAANVTDFEAEIPLQEGTLTIRRTAAVGFRLILPRPLNTTEPAEVLAWVNATFAPFVTGPARLEVEDHLGPDFLGASVIWGEGTRSSVLTIYDSIPWPGMSSTHVTDLNFWTEDSRMPEPVGLDNDTLRGFALDYVHCAGSKADLAGMNLTAEGDSVTAFSAARSFDFTKHVEGHCPVAHYHVILDRVTGSVLASGFSPCL